MSNKNSKIYDRKKSTLDKLRKAQEIFVPMSDCTNMPFVLCDPETYDDEVLVFFDEETAKREAGELLRQKNPLHIIRLEQKFLLSFYSSLLPMGVNALLVDKGTPKELRLQLSELISRKGGNMDANGKKIVENPEFMLTALYFMQVQRAQKDPEITEEVEELQEEMLAHYSKGHYIVAYQKDRGLPILKQKDGTVMQPVFTDVQEFIKFQNTNKDVSFQTAVIEAGKLPEIMAKEAAGIVVDPYSINLHLKVQRMASKTAARPTTQQILAAAADAGVRASLQVENAAEIEARQAMQESLESNVQEVLAENAAQQE